MTSLLHLPQPVDPKITALYRADLIIRTRETNSLTQEDLAKLLGVKPATLSRWEGLRRPIPQRRANEIGAFLNVTLPLLNSNMRYDPLNQATNILNRARKIHGHNVLRCAKRLGVEESSIYNWENNFAMNNKNGVKVAQYIRNAELKMEARGINIALLSETKFRHNDASTEYFDCTHSSEKDWIKAWKKFIATISKALSTPDYEDEKADDWKNQFDDVMKTVADTSAWRQSPEPLFSTGDPEPMKEELNDAHLFAVTSPKEEIPHQHTVQIVDRRDLKVDTITIVMTASDEKLKLIADFAQHVHTNFIGNI